MSAAHASHQMFGTINYSGSKSPQGGIARALSLHALQFSTIPAGSMPSSEVLLSEAAEHAQDIQKGSQVRLPLRHPSDWLAVDLGPRLCATTSTSFALHYIAALWFLHSWSSQKNKLIKEAISRTKS